MYLRKFGKNLTIGSKDIVQTRKCHNNANVIRTKICMYVPSP